MRRLAPFLWCAATMLACPSPASALHPEYVHHVANQSSREGSRPRLIVLHTTRDIRHRSTEARQSSAGNVRDLPGIRDLKRLGAWFDKPRHRASSHVANDAEGNDARYVRDSRKAWTQCRFNAVSLSIEQIGSAEYERHVWITKRWAQLENTARRIAYWHRKWGIPIRRAAVSGGAVTRAGVATHRELGRAGCGHHDPGAGYPFKRVLELARSFDRRDRRRPVPSAQDQAQPGRATVTPLTAPRAPTSTIAPR